MDIGRVANVIQQCLGVGRGIDLFRLPGYDASCEYPDLLHCLWLGTGRDAVGALTMLLARFFPPVQHLDTFDERLRHIHFDIRDWCKQHGLRPSTIDELSLFATHRFVCEITKET